MTSLTEALVAAQETNETDKKYVHVFIFIY